MPKTFLACLLAALLWGAPVLAQQTRETDLDDRLDAVEVTATKVGLSRDKVPFSVFTVDSERQQKESPHGYFNTVGEMVSEVPGVYVAEFYPWGLSWIQLRGTGHGLNRSVYMVDGLPIYFYQNSTINAHDIAQVDVLLGPSSALYGASAAGGVVNMITRSGYAGMGVNLEFAYGSRDTFRPHFHFGNAVNFESSTLRFYVSYTGDFSDGYRMQPVEDRLKAYYLNPVSANTDYSTASMEDNYFRYHYLATRLDWENENHTTLSLSVNYAQRFLHGGQPGYTALDDAEQWLASFRASTRLGGWGQVKLAAGWQSIEAFSIVPNGITRVGPAWSYLYTQDPTPAIKQRAYGTGNRSQAPFDLQIDIRPVDWNVTTAGMFYSRGRVTNQYTMSIRPANYGQVSAFGQYDEEQKSFYFQNATTLFNDRFTFIAGLRYDKWIYDNIYINGNPKNVVNEAIFDALTYRFGAKYNINENFGIRAAYGTAYYQNAQNMFQSGWSGDNNTGTFRATNTDLKPEQTWMTEFGVDFKKPEWGTEATLTYYFGNIKDSHVTVQNIPDPTGAVTGKPGGSYTQSRNMGKVEVRGVELGLKQTLIPDLLTFSASVTFNDSVVKVNNSATTQNVGNQISHAPKYVGSYSLLLTKPDVVNASVTYKHTDDRWYNDSHQDYLHYHMRNVDVWNAKIWRDWTISDNFTVTTSLVGTNLTDLDYEAQYTYLAPGRYFEGLVSMTWYYD